MLRLNITNNVICFKDIKPNQLPDILKWYNNSKDFKYATGVDQPITMASLILRYEEVAICCSEFFVGIYENNSGKMIGILKGRVKDKKSKVLWISSLAIDPNMQGRGFGGLAISLLLEFMKENNGIRIVYISVIEDNIQGMRFWGKMSFTSIKKIEKNIELNGQKHSTIIMQKFV